METASDVLKLFPPFLVFNHIIAVFISQELRTEIHHIGNNINQIAHWANAQKSIHEPEIVEAAVLANRAWRLVKDTL